MLPGERIDTAVRWLELVPYAGWHPDWKNIFRHDIAGTGVGTLWHCTTICGANLIKAHVVVPSETPVDKMFPEVAAECTADKVTQKLVKIFEPGNAIVEISMKEDMQMYNLFSMFEIVAAPSSPNHSQVNNTHAVHRLVKCGLPRPQDTITIQAPSAYDVPTLSFMALITNEEELQQVQVSVIVQVSSPFSPNALTDLAMQKLLDTFFMASVHRVSSVPFTLGSVMHDKYYVALSMKRCSHRPLLPQATGQVDRPVKWQEQEFSYEQTTATYLYQFLEAIGIYNISVYGSYDGWKLPPYIAIMKAQDWEMYSKQFFEVFSSHSTAYKSRYCTTKSPCWVVKPPGELDFRRFQPTLPEVPSMEESKLNDLLALHRLSF